MPEENLAKTPVENNAAETAVETTPETSVAENTDAPTDGEKPEGVAEKKEPTEAEKVKAAMQKRIDKLTAKLHAELRQREAQEGNPRTAQKQDDGAPKEADFNTYEDYLIAKGKHEAKKEFEAAQNEAKKKESDTARQAKLAAKNQEFVVKEAEFRKDKPDYDDAVGVLNEYITTVNHKSAEFQVFRDVLMNAPDLPALSYHLGKNPDLVESLMTMEPAQIAWTLIETAVGLKNTKSNPQTKPLPAPIKAVSGKGASEKAISSMSPRELTEWLKQK